MRGTVGTSTYIFNLFPKKLAHLIDSTNKKKLPKEVKFRLNMLEFYYKHKNASLTTRRFAVSKSTFYKWRKRFEKEGIEGLFDKPKTPKKKRQPTTRSKYKDIVIEIRKKHPNWSSKKIAKYLEEEEGIKISHSTVNRILNENGLIEKSKKKKYEKQRAKAIIRKRIRKGLKANNTGDVIQIDTKHLQQAGKTYYQFTAIDKYSRMTYAKVYPTKSSRNAKKFFQEVEEYFEFEIKKVQTDNGSEFLGEFHKYLEERGIEHYFSYPNSPKTNAVVERVIRTIEEELWLYEGTNYELEELNRKLRKYIRIYNFIRPHQGINFKKPADLVYR